MPISKQRLGEIASLKEEDIDYSDIPELEEDWFERASLILPHGRSVPVDLDNDVVEWYRTQDRNFQAKINAILRAYMNKHKAHA